jgi:hypothetical protein
MAGWRPIKRRDFTRKLRALGFGGPFSGTRHQFMTFGGYHQTIPSNSEYSVPQVGCSSVKSNPFSDERFRWESGTNFDRFILHSRAVHFSNRTFLNRVSECCIRLLMSAGDNR